jgi:hypothetical protein
VHDGGVGSNEEVWQDAAFGSSRALELQKCLTSEK